MVRFTDRSTKGTMYKKAVIEPASANLNFFLNLSVLSFVFAVECSLARVLLGWPGVSLIPWAAVGVAYGFHKLAILCAKKWYGWINAAYDLYRHQLADTLALEPFKDVEDEKNSWEGISYFVRRGSWRDFGAFRYPLPDLKDAKAQADTFPCEVSSNEST